MLDSTFSDDVDELELTVDVDDVDDDVDDDDDGDDTDDGLLNGDTLSCVCGGSTVADSSSPIIFVVSSLGSLVANGSLIEFNRVITAFSSGRPKTKNILNYPKNVCAEKTFVPLSMVGVSNDVVITDDDGLLFFIRFVSFGSKKKSCSSSVSSCNVVGIACCVVNGRRDGLL